MTVGSITYNLVFDNQLPDVQAHGLVVATASGSTTSVPWGSVVGLQVDSYAPGKPYAPCMSGNAVNQMTVSVSKIAPST